MYLNIMRKVRLAVNNNIFLMSIERELSKYTFIWQNIIFVQNSFIKYALKIRWRNMEYKILTQCTKLYKYCILEQKLENESNLLAP